MAILDKKGRKMKKKFAYIMVKSEDYLLLYKEGGNGNRKNSASLCLHLQFSDDMGPGVKESVTAVDDI